MAKRFIHFFKIFGITFGAFLGCIGVYLGIVFLITGFKPEVIALTNLKFSQDEYFFSDKDENGEDVENITIMVVSEPENTTQKQVVIDFVKGVGSDVVELPVAEGADKCIVNVNEPIPLKLKKNAQTSEVIGGEIHLQAYGAEKDTNSIYNECFIYIDTPVSSFDVRVTKGEEQAEVVTYPVELATKIYPGYVLDFGVKSGSVLPENSEQPFKAIYDRQVKEGVKEENLIRNDVKKVYWESSDTTRATVDNNGKVTILETAAAGEVTITARIYKTYELQDNHKTLFDFEYDVNISQDQVDVAYEEYVTKITATKSITLKISDMGVKEVQTSKPTSVNDFHHSVGVNKTITYYLDGDHIDENGVDRSLHLSIIPSNGITEQFTSEDLRYKLSSIYIYASNIDGGINDCLRVSSIAGNLDTGFYFTVSANYSQNFIEKGTCLIVGLGVWDEETQSLKREPNGMYTKAKDIDGNEIPEITIHMEITTKEAELLAIASSEIPYTNIDLIPAKQEITVDVIGSVKLDAYIRYTNNEGAKVTVSGKAGKLTNDLTYSMVAFFVPDGTEIIDYDKTYGIDLGGMWYPIGQAPITDCYNAEMLAENSILTNFKGQGEITVIAVLLKTDSDGRVLLVDEYGKRPTDEDGNLIDPSNYQDYVDTKTLFYDFTIKSGTQDAGGSGKVNNFEVTVGKKFDPTLFSVSQKYGDMEDYVVLSAENGNLEQTYINDGSSEDYVYLWAHYEEDSTTGSGILKSAYNLGNFVIESDGNFAKIDDVLTSDGTYDKENTEGNDVLFVMGKMGNTSKPITVKFILNGEIIFSYSVAITNKQIEKLYLETNAVKEVSDNEFCEKITVKVAPSDQNANSNWEVSSYNKETQSTNQVPLDIYTQLSYAGDEENLFKVDDQFEIQVFYSIAYDYDGEYSSMVKRNGTLIAQLTNNDRYFLTSKTQPDNDYYGTISFHTAGIIYLKATITPLFDEIQCEKIYEIHIVVDEENWEFNKKTSPEKTYLQVDMPLINNTAMTGEAKYTKIPLDASGIGGLTGTYAQLYDTDETNFTNDVTTLLIDLSKFVSISYKGTTLKLSNMTENTAFLQYQIKSYNIYSPTSQTYDISKNATYNKAEIFYNEEEQLTYLRVKAVNHNTRITLTVSTYFGVKSEFVILVTSPLTYKITSNFNEANQEYIASGMELDLFTRVNISTKSYIQNNEWVGEADLTNTSFNNLIKSYLINTGVANETNNTDTQTYIETNQTPIFNVVKDTIDMVSFKLNMVFDLDKSTENGTLNNQENAWVTYYYTRLIPISNFDTNYLDNVYQYNGTTYQNIFAGQSYDLGALGYVIWTELKLNDTKTAVELDNGGKPVYIDKTSELQLKFESTAYEVSSDGYTLYSGTGTKIATIVRNDQNYYNILRIEPNVFGENATSAILASLKVDSEGAISNYNIRINPLSINVTSSGAIETYVGTNYDMNDCITIKSATSDNTVGLTVKYQVLEILESVDNKPTIEIDNNGLITIKPQTFEDSEGNIITLNPTKNFNFEVEVKVGELTKIVTFVCGRITASQTSSESYKYSNIIENDPNEITYVSMLEGSIISAGDIVKLRSSIVEEGSGLTSKEIYFSNYQIKDNKFILWDNENNTEISKLNMKLGKTNDTFNIYFKENILVSVNSLTGRVEATTYLPDNYSLYLFVTCIFNSSYTYDLPIRVNSIVFTSLLEQEDDINKTVDEEGNVTVYLVSTVDENSELGILNGNYITAKSINFINASNSNQNPYNSNGDIMLELTFGINAMDNVEIVDLNSVKEIRYKNSSTPIAICTIDRYGKIATKFRLTDRYEFTLEVMYTYNNATSVHSICSYKIVILPEYSLVQKDEDISYTQDNPYTVKLADTTTINLLNSTNGVMLLKKVCYTDNKIEMNNDGVVFEMINSVSPTIMTVSFEFGLVDENDPNRPIIASECSIRDYVFYLPRSISSDVLIRITAGVAIHGKDKISYYDYFFMIEAGVDIELHTDIKNSKVIQNELYYNVTTPEVEGTNLILDLGSVFSVIGDTNNIQSNGIKIQIESAYLEDYMGNALVQDGIELKDNTISLKNNTSTIATISYANVAGVMRLSTSYSMQKVVYMKLNIAVSYRDGTVNFKLNIRMLPKVLISSTAQNTMLPIIAGEIFKFNNNLSLTAINPETFEYGTPSEEIKQQFASTISFKVEGEKNSFPYDSTFSTSAALTSITEKKVEIVLTNNLQSITLFTYTLKIYPLYKFTVEETNTDGQIELFEGQTEVLPNKYVFVESVKQENGSYVLYNGEPYYVINQEQTDKLVIEVPTTHQNYAKSIENVKVYIKQFTNDILSVNAKLAVGGEFMTHVINVKVVDIIIELEKFENQTVTSANPIVLPAGTNEQILMLSRLTDDTEMYFYNLYYTTNEGTKLLYYNNSASYHNVIITGVNSKSGLYAQKQGLENVVEYTPDPTVIISFADNKLTVSGRINEEINVTVQIRVGDVIDSAHTMYFTFYPVNMVNVVKDSYINDSGENFQILTPANGERVLINQYLRVNSDYKIGEMTYKPAYDFTSRIKFVFPTDGLVDAVSGAFRHTVNGTQDSVLITTLDNDKVTISLIKDSSGTYLDIDSNLWNTSIQEFELVVKAQIGLVETYLKFYVSSVAFKYNYAYRASTGVNYYYHSMYIDYAYNKANPYETSNEIDITGLLMGNTSGVTFKLERANMNDVVLTTTNQSANSVTCPQMGTLSNVVGLVTGVDKKEVTGNANDVTLNYAFLRYVSGRYKLSFNVKTKTIKIGQSSYHVPIIDEALDIYITMAKGDIKRTIHFEILPYIQMVTSLNDTYERVNDQGTKEDVSDDTVELYDYYLSGNTYKLDYFYDYQFTSCYDDTQTLVKDIKNTVLTRVSLSNSVGVEYQVTSYEDFVLESSDSNGNYIEKPLSVATSLPSDQKYIKFDDATLTIDAELDRVIYIIVLGRAGNGYESKFYMKIIPNILFASIEENDGYVNKTTSGERFEFVTIPDSNASFLSKSVEATAKVSSFDANGKPIVDLEVLVETVEGTKSVTYHPVLDIAHNDIRVGQVLTINYDPKDPTKAVMGGFSDCLARITTISGNTYTVEFEVLIGETKVPTTAQFTYKGDHTLTVNTKVLIKYSRDARTVIKYVGYLKQEGTFTDSNAVETILTGKSYDLREYLTAFTPSIENNRIQEFYDDSTNANYTVYTDKSLDYKVKYAWYYTSNYTNENGTTMLALMADITPEGNVVIEGQEVITIENDVITANSELAFDVYINIEGTYVYNTTKSYTRNFYLRIVPALKFFILDTSNMQEHEAGQGRSVLAIESVSDEYVEEMDDGTRMINLNNYIKGKKIVSEDNKIQINGNIVAYSNQLPLTYTINSAKVYTIISDTSSASEAVGEVASNMLLKQNGLVLNDGKFTLEKTYNATCDINLTVVAVIDDMEFKFDILIQLYRESLIEVEYYDPYVQDDSIIYETIVSGSTRNSILFNSSYLKPYVWSTKDSEYKQATDFSGNAEIYNISICKANSPAGPDKTSIKDKIVKISSGSIIAENEILGDYYFTIQLKLFYGGDYNIYTFYFRVLGKYVFENASLEKTYTTNEQIVYNQIIERQRTEEDGDKPIYETVKIMTKTPQKSDGLILIGTRTIENNKIKVVYNNTFLSGLELQSANVETASGVWNSPNAIENQFTFTYTKPTSSNQGSVSLGFNDAYYNNIKETKKSLYITLNFTFSYTHASFTDIYSIQYEIMFVPNEE